jgi:3-hydroxyisobutyrate dehydrogenase-like beta-hydroxyacid dehydrogenase
MPITVAVVAQGTMGAGVGHALSHGGATVLTSLAGRSAASLKRAEAAGMRSVSDADLVGADIILSIVPPGDAIAFAQRMAPFLQRAVKKPVFADCNAVSPKTAGEIAAIVAPTGAPFIDAGIIGGPPKPGVYSPAIYASGPEAKRLAALNDYGLDIRVMEAAIGAASGLKMSYAGITKGVTALGSAMMLAAARSGAAQGLRGELAASQKSLTLWFERQVPGMYSKAYRWVAEMREIAEFVGDDPAASAMYEAIAKFYERLAADEAGDRREVSTLDAFLALKPAG